MKMIHSLFCEHDSKRHVVLKDVHVYGRCYVVSEDNFQVETFEKFRVVKLLVFGSSSLLSVANYEENF